MPRRRTLCGRCTRPLPACLCRWVCPTANRLPLLLLMHPLEANHAKNSATLLKLSLSQCRVEVGDAFDDNRLQHTLASGALLLYPSGVGNPAAPPPPHVEQVEQVEQLVLLDGTWRQTRRLLHRHPLLQALPRWALPTVPLPPPPSRYAMRKAARPDQRSTLEAACLALAHLEQRPAHYDALLQAFAEWAARWGADWGAERVADRSVITR
ncbi:MAG: DTW domain-containing protein [Rubrivivax sp.]|nr:DTW domain-containing protein [Rubrivivax sp.]